MFIRLSEALGQRYDIFSFHPLQLQTAMDVVWEYSRQNVAAIAPATINDAGIGGPLPPAARRDATSLRDELLRVLQPSTSFGGIGGDELARALATMLTDFAAETNVVPRYWHHLIYAYMIENTRALAVFEKVLHEILHGERLGAITDKGQRWARATEELFFRNQGFSFISSLQSTVRPDAAATRRNAYYRMFAMDLNHGTADNKPYPYVKAEASNRDFVATLESLLAEIWRAYMNATNTSGPNTTDDSVIADLAAKLQEMLTERRTNGSLTREEFVAVSTMSWFHLTLSSPDSPIITDLKGNASTPEERLRKVAERVGMASHSKARSLFFLAEPLSALLIEIERGTFSSATAVRPLYDPNVTPNVARDTLEVLNHWANATGKNLKAMPVTGSR